MNAAELFPPRSAGVRPADFAGEYSFSHDGWPGTLTLQVQGGRNLRGTYRDERLDGTFTVIGKIDPAARHRVVLTIQEFNWLDEQRFTGHLFTRGARGIAGTTLWKDEPFGFLASVAPVLEPDVYRTGAAEPGDFAAEYDVVLDGLPGVAELAHAGGRELTGRLSCAGVEVALRGEVGADVPYAVSLRPSGDPRVASVRFSGHLFSRPKSTIAGTVEGPGGAAGFFMRKRS
ncbi:hypothetical protein [Actinomadura sp. 9N215]|uniref:hypothetical protein n=1 Tax=Actinomadura sp. 9N215 TaxID=3375150 RepID=UPI0037AD72C5